VLIAATATVALAALLPVTSLVTAGSGGLGTRLDLPPWRGGDVGIAWSPLAWGPAATRQAALVTLFHLLAGVVAGVCAVAGLSIVSLSVARASQRQPELALRRAVGASRRHVLGAVLLESGAIALGALVVGGLVGAVAAQLALAAWPGSVGSPGGEQAANVVAVLATIGGVVGGALLPLALPRRTTPLPPSGGRPLALAVPALQLGLGLTVLTGALLLERQADRLTAPGHGAPAAGRVFELTAPQGPAAARAAAYRSLLGRLEGRRPRAAVSLTSPGTLVGLGTVDVVTTDCGQCSLGGLAYPLHPVAATHYLVSADTFRVLDLALVAGRGISDADRWGGPRVAVVSRSLAEHHFQQGEAVGRRILVGGAEPEWYTVVGVVADRRPAGFGGGFQPLDAVYLSVLQHPGRAVEVFMRGMPGSALLNAVPHGVAVRPGSVTALVAAEVAPLRWFGRMLGVEGWVILGLATLGCFVVMRLWVASLRYELGVRRAVGARRRAVIGFVLARAAGVAVGGVLIGLWVGLMAWGALATVVAGLPAWDLQAALRYAPVLAGATLAGALWPAWQAARARPAQLTD
jgi:hypothetical protein